MRERRPDTGSTATTETRRLQNRYLGAGSPMERGYDVWLLGFLRTGPLGLEKNKSLELKGIFLEHRYRSKIDLKDEVF